MKELYLESHAKINLALKIVGKFPDGYHKLETIFQRIDLKDMITLKETNKGIKITSDSADMPLDEKNLAYRAAEKILNKAGVDKGVDIHIRKKIPMGAGLGGGSSNAATVLRGLDDMWELGLGRDVLSPIARELGADVPFFLYDNCAMGVGRGDILEPILNKCKFWVVLIYPGIHISTPWVYGNFQINLTKTANSIKILKVCLKSNKAGEIPGKLVNDLESVVFPAYPEIAKLKKDLLNAGALNALMSGSGSVVFGLFDSPGLASEAMEKLTGENRTLYSVGFAP